MPGTTLTLARPVLGLAAAVLMGGAVFLVAPQLLAPKPIDAVAPAPVLQRQGPGTPPEPRLEEATVIPDPLPPVVEAGPRQQVLTVAPGDTLMEMLLGAGVPGAEAATVIDLLRPHVDPRDIKPGLDLALTFAPTAEGEALQALSLQPDVVRTVTVARDAEGVFAAETKAVPVQRDTVAARMVIRSSLYEAAREADIPYGVLTAAVRAFSYDVDFQRDIQPGDVFDVVYEHTVTETGEIVTAGPVTYARLGLSGKDLAIHRFAPKDGEAEFFDPSGAAIRKTLLRTPLDAVRITSGFGMRRHPILGYTKMHRGVDFGAPTGTPIYAAGDGTVVEAGVKGGYGNYIRIRHASGVETAYAHLSRFAKSTKSGARVSQGGVIGYVGSTGRSTGPHLHFEVLKGGQPVDPAKAAVSTQHKLAGNDLKTFRALIQRNEEMVRHLSGMFELTQR